MLRPTRHALPIVILIATTILCLARCRHVTGAVPETSSGARSVANAATLRLTLVQREAGSSHLLLTLGKVRPDCEPVFVDSMFTPYDYHQRRGSTLTLEIRDADGRVVQPGGLPSPSVMRAAEDDMVRIDCENRYDIGIDVVRHAFYRYTLPPGRYRVKAVLTLSMRSLAARFPDLRDYAVRSAGQTGQNAEDYLLDALVESDTIEIEIR